MKHIVLLSTHNGAAFLPRALAAAEAAFVGTEWLLIAGCDGCTDGSYQAISSAPLSCSYKIIVEFDKAASPAEAKNRAVRLAQPFLNDDAYVYWIDDDDEILLPARTELQAALEKTPTALYAAGSFLRRRQSVIEQTNIRNCLKFYSIPPTATVARAALYKGEMDFFPADYPMSEDSAQWIRLGYKKDIWPLLVETNPVVIAYAERRVSVSRPGVRAAELHSFILKRAHEDFHTVPRSFSTSVTKEFLPSFLKWYKHMREFHPETPVFVLSDGCMKEMPGVVDFPVLKPDTYRTEIWEAKPSIAATACWATGNTMWMDCDLFLLAPAYVPDATKAWAVPEVTVYNDNRFGAYNAGMIHIPSAQFAEEFAAVIAKAPIPRHPFAKELKEQCALQLLDVQPLNGQVNNLGHWKINSKIETHNNTLFFDGFPARSLHAHLFEPTENYEWQRQYLTKVKPLYHQCYGSSGN